MLSATQVESLLAEIELLSETALTDPEAQEKINRLEQRIQTIRGGSVSTELPSVASVLGG